MARKRSSQRKHLKPKAVLRLPGLDQAKSAVLNSLTSADAQRGYRHAIDEFVEWYCSEPRLAFNRTVVLRYRIHLEQRGYRAGHHQSAAGCGSPHRGRGGRGGPLESRAGRPHPTRQRPAADRRPSWELIDTRAKAEAPPKSAMPSSP